MKRFSFFKKPKIEAVENILIVKTSSIGDILQAFCILPFLKKKLPKAKIYWAVEEKLKHLVENHPLIEEAVSIDRKKKRVSYRNIRKRAYDLLFDLQGNTKSALVTFLAKSTYKVGFSKASVKEFPNILATNTRFEVSLEKNIRDQYLHLIASFFQENSPPLHEVLCSFIEKEEEKLFATTLIQKLPKEKRILFVAPWSKWENKELSFSFLKNWLQKIEKAYSPFFLFVWGDPKEEEKTRLLQKAFPKSSLVIEKSPFFSLKAIIERCDGVIASDSSLLHLTFLTSTPSFSFFGPTSKNVFSPMRKEDEAIQGKCPYKIEFIKQCPFLRSCSTGRCLKDLTGEDLFKSFSSWYSFILKNKKNSLFI